MCCISFIIPVYNGKETITRTLDSIASLGMANDQYEIIVVDDCSTDDTISVLEEKEKTMPALIVLSLQTNKKPGGARNIGLAHAKGKYVMFVDADDTVEEGLNDALTYAMESNLDILHCIFRKQIGFNSEFISSPANALAVHTTVDGKTFCNDYYNLADVMASYLFCNDFLKRTNRPFVEGLIFEDTDWVEYHLFHCKSIQCDSNVIYSNFATPGSILHSLDISKDADVILYSYRRLSFAYSVRNEVPDFYENVLPIKAWIDRAFSFRHMTRHTGRSARLLFLMIGRETLAFLKVYKWTGFNKLCVNYPILAVCTAGLAHPFAAMGRYLYNLVTKKNRDL